MDCSMESRVDMPTFHMESNGIHVELIIPSSFHMEYMDSIWNNPGKVETSMQVAS